MKHVASRAFEPSDPVSGQLLSSLINRCFPAIKPVMRASSFLLLLIFITITLA